MSRRVIRFPRPALEPVDGGWVATFDLLEVSEWGTTSQAALEAAMREIERKMGELGREGLELFAGVFGEDLGSIPDDVCILDVERDAPAPLRSDGRQS
jgi:hypothetical protein